MTTWTKCGRMPKAILRAEKLLGEIFDRPIPLLEPRPRRRSKAARKKR